MVQVTFHPSLDQKTKTCTDDPLIPTEAGEEGGYKCRSLSRRSYSRCMRVGVALMLVGVAMGVIVGGWHLYMYYARQLREDDLQSYMLECSIVYDDMAYMEEDEVGEPLDYAQLHHVQEAVRVLEEEGVELISVPMPEFSDSNPANIVHDFHRNLTAYLDLVLDKCYVIALNESNVLPPKNLTDLLAGMKAGTPMHQLHMVREQLQVAEQVSDTRDFGLYIHTLCDGRQTYRLERRRSVTGIQKREAVDCHKIRHFENVFVTETLICEA